MKIIAALFTLICVCTTSSAQTFTERLQKNNTGKGTVKVVHSAAIDKLVNGNQPDIKPEKPTTAKQTEQKEKKLSYWSKTKCHCPVCHKDFPKEEMLTGGGRMIAGELTGELHRVYEPSAKYGVIYPLLYSIGACPNCHSAFFWKDFEI